MSLLFNMLSRFVIAFPPRSKCLLNSWLQSLSTVILEHKKIKSVTVILFPFFPHLFAEWFALEANRDHSVVLRLHPSTAFQILLLTKGYSFTLKGFLPAVVDIMVI